MTDEQQRVLEKIPTSPGRVMQHQLAMILPNLGPHRYDSTVSEDTTLRRIRWIIRELRVTHKKPILANRKGYYMPQNQQEAEKYLERMEREARARAKASMVTYAAMRDALHVRSEFFDKQLELGLL